MKSFMCQEGGCHTFRKLALARDTILDLIEHVFLGVVRIHSRVFLRIWERHETLSTLLLEGVLDEVSLASIVHPGEGVAAIAVEVPPVRMTRVREEHGACMVRFRHIGQEIERGVVVDEEGLRIAALRANVVGTLHGIPDEEDRPVETDEIVVALFSVELYSKASGVTSKIRELLAECHSRESEE